VLSSSGLFRHGSDWNEQLPQYHPPSRNTGTAKRGQPQEAWGFCTFFSLLSLNKALSHLGPPSFFHSWNSHSVKRTPIALPDLVNSVFGLGICDHLLLSLLEISEGIEYNATLCLAQR
jgi:hypothetical protein